MVIDINYDGQLEFYFILLIKKQKMLGDELMDQEDLKKKQEKLFEQQKKFRNLENDKKLFAEETINFIKKQKISIDKLKK